MINQFNYGGFFMQKEYYDTREAAIYFGGAIKPNTLEIWRIQGRGPRFIKFGRAVRYRKADLDKWIEERERQNTSQES